MFSAYSYLSSWMVKLSRKAQHEKTEDQFNNKLFEGLRRLRAIHDFIVESHYVDDRPKLVNSSFIIQNTLPGLPNDIIMQILAYLPIPTLCAVSLVNQRLYGLSCSDRLWKRSIADSFPELYLDNLHSLKCLYSELKPVAVLINLYQYFSRESLSHITLAKKVQEKLRKSRGKYVKELLTWCQLLINEN